MHNRVRWPGAWRWGVVLGTAALAAAGCGVVNPSLVAATGGNTVSDFHAPDGYIMILLMNRSLVPVTVSVDITKANGGLKRWDLSTGSLGYFAFAQDCDTAVIQFVSFNDGSTITPANLGALIRGQSMNCGSVVAVTAEGNPPAFKVEVVP